MLTENDVVGAVREYLERQGYLIKRTATTNQRGIDIVALHPSSGRIVLVEAKGETTSKNSARQGEAFSRAQCRTHIAVALYTAARLRDSPTKRAKQVVAIALPDVPPHPELVESRDAGTAHREFQSALVNGNE